MQLKLAPWNWYKPSSKIFLLTGGTSFVDHLCYLCLVFVMLLRRFFAALWSPAGKGLTSWLLFVCLIVFLSISHMVSWVMCRTWLYWFLIFATFLTFIVAAYDISSPKVTYTYYTFNSCFLFMKSSVGGWLTEYWKELVFFVKIDFN